MNDNQHVLRTLVDNVDLAGVFMQECSAKRYSSEDFTEAEVNVESSHKMTDNELMFKFTISCSPTSVEAQSIADLSVTHSAVFAGSIPAECKDENTINSFAEEVAFMAVYPYAREVLQSLGMRLDISGLTLGLFKRGDLQIDRPGSDTAFGPQHEG